MRGSAGLDLPTTTSGRHEPEPGRSGASSIFIQLEPVRAMSLLTVPSASQWCVPITSNAFLPGAQNL